MAVNIMMRASNIIVVILPILIKYRHQKTDSCKILPAIINMLNILMKVVWVLNIFAQVDLLVNHHLREHEDDQDAARVH